MIRQMLAAVVLITFTGCVPAEQGASERPVVLLLKILVPGIIGPRTVL